MSKFHVRHAIKILAAMQDPLLEFTQRFIVANGFVLPEHGQAAREWCRSRALAGDADAQVAYAQLLTHGIFGVRDDDAAFLWSQRAAERSHAAAMVAFSPYIEKGRGNHPRDPARALELIKTAAEKGYAPAWTILAAWYEFGTYVEENPRLAMEHHRKAASLGFAGSQYALGMYLIYKLSPPECQEGLVMLEAAARQDLYLAHEALGTLFSKDELGVPIDHERARHHRETAKKLEDEAGTAFGDIV